MWSTSRRLPARRQTIVLAHGILGFGTLPFPFSQLTYFNGVAAHLSQQGHTVIAPNVNPIGSIADRGRMLAEAILEVPIADDEKLHVIAHSMGGLDARHALSNIQEDDISARGLRRVTAIRKPSATPSEISDEPP